LAKTFNALQGGVHHLLKPPFVNIVTFEVTRGEIVLVAGWRCDMPALKRQINSGYSRAESLRHLLITRKALFSGYPVLGGLD
jgi:hypothetical protein